MSRRTREGDRYTVVVNVANLGHPDGTTRATWEARASVRRWESTGLGRIGVSEGKRPEVAAARAVRLAFERPESEAGLAPGEYLRAMGITE